MPSVRIGGLLRDLTGRRTRAQRCQMRLLVVEDERGIAAALRQGLTEAGYAVRLECGR
jgi:hypothetical protein